MLTKWVLEADLDFLEPAIRFADLNPNAIREYPGPTRVCALTYPSPFCRDSVLWMRALSHLVVRNRDFELFLVNMTSEAELKETGRTRIYPVLDNQVIRWLTQINQADADDLQRQSRRVEEVIEHLKHRASNVLKHELTRLYEEE
ncbi:hypothetical protein [Nisaea sp.]|uniref:hypothetical protein n=1 Tax=Nisaea sp. TaxID=2024842 RepID=UPI003B5169BF